MDARPEDPEEQVRRLEERLRDRPDDERVLEELGWALTKLGWHRRDLGDVPGAEGALRAALKHRERRARSRPSPEAGRDLARACREVARIIERVTRAGEAEALHRRALELQEARHQEAPDEPGTAQDLASSLRDLASLAHDGGRNAEAQALLARAGALIEGLAARTVDTNDRIDLLEDLAWTRGREAFLLERLGRLRDAERSARSAASVLDGLLAEQPAHEHRVKWSRELGAALTQLGGWLERADRFEEAEAALADAIAALDAALGSSDISPLGRDLATSDLVDSLRALELVLHNQGRRDDARQARARATLAARRRPRS